MFLADLFGASLPVRHPSSGAWWINMGGSRSTAGEFVDEAATISFSAVYSGMRFIAETTARLPMNVHERFDRDGQKASRIPDGRPEQRILHVSPDGEITTGDWREQLVAQAILRGNAYSQIIREERGRGAVRRIRPLNSLRVRPERTNEGRGRLIYRVTDERGRLQATVPAENMIHVRNFPISGVCGLGLVDLAKDAIGMGLATESFGARFFANYMRPSGFISFARRFKDRLAAQKRIQEALSQEHGGENQHRVAVLEEDMKWEPMGVNPEEAQFLETRRFQVTEIARFLRLPPHILMALENASYNNIEELGREVLRYALDPWMVRIEQELTLKLFGDEPEFFVKHNRNALARAAMKERWEAYRIALQEGVYSPNMVLEFEDLDPYEGGDDRRRAMNSEVVGANGDQPAERDQRIDHAIAGLVRSAVERCVARESRALGLQLSKASDASDFLSRVRSFFAGQHSFVVDTVNPVLAIVAAVLGDFDTVVVAGDFAKRSEEWAMEALASAKTKPELLASWEAGRVERLIDDLQARIQYAAGKEYRHVA